MTNLNLENFQNGALILLAIVIIWQFLKIRRLDVVRKHFYSVGMKKNLEFLMTEHDEAIKKLFAGVSDLNDQTETIRTQNRLNFQKVGFVRYSQFGEAGNLSFSLVLLDDHLNGFALSSLHGREGVRSYAKQILDGKSKAKLTDEEIQALTNAIHGAQ